MSAVQEAGGWLLLIGLILIVWFPIGLVLSFILGWVMRRFPPPS